MYQKKLFTQLLPINVHVQYLLISIKVSRNWTFNQKTVVKCATFCFDRRCSDKLYC